MSVCADYGAGIGANDFPAKVVHLNINKIHPFIVLRVQNMLQCSWLADEYKWKKNKQMIQIVQVLQQTLHINILVSYFMPYQIIYLGAAHTPNI